MYKDNKMSLKPTHLNIGDSAPQFTAIDALGTSVDLKRFKDKYVLLVFLRYSGCPWCNLTIHRLSLEYTMLSQNGCEVLAFVQSSAENIQKHIYDRHKVKPLYSIVADPKRKYYDMYGVGTSVKAAVHSIIDIPYWIKSAYELGFHQPKIDGNLLIVPAMFLVGPDNQDIVKSEYGSSFYDHRTFTDIYEPLFFK
jgi:peroxiredoxin